MDDHWLTRESTIRRLWIVFAIVLAATVLMDLVIEHHPYFGLDGTFGFGAWFGFAQLRRPDRVRQGARRHPEAAGHLL